MVSVGFFINLTLWPHYGPGADSASERNEYQRYLLGRGRGKVAARCVGLTTLPPSCADCQEIPGASTSRSSKGLSRHIMG